MKLLDCSEKGATFYLSERELLMVTILVQEGRFTFECAGPTGQALDELFRTAAAMVHKARSNGNESDIH